MQGILKSTLAEERVGTPTGPGELGPSRAYLMPCEILEDTWIDISLIGVEVEEGVL